jgi:hypothetical protein
MFWGVDETRFAGYMFLGFGAAVGTSGLIVTLTSLQRGATSREATAVPAH